MTIKNKTRRLKSRLMGVAILSTAIFGCFATSGCQVSVGGQTLPSAYYMKDDLQYFPKGPEFALTQEADALKAARANELLNR